jgi:methionyl-tRNA formyltransferase
MSIAMMLSSSGKQEKSNVTNVTADQADARPLQSLRVGFWGTHSLFSQVVLTTLLEHYPISVVALPAGAAQDAPVTRWSPPSLPAIPPVIDELVIVNNLIAPPIVQRAWQQGIPVYQVQQLRSPLVTQWLAELALDLVCVACFPWRIPDALLALPTYGFLNVHPSHLPAYRGPAPLFWQLRDGLQQGGVTVHWMDAAFDSGPIAAQSALALPVGATSAELDQLHALTGADLLLDVLGQLATGRRPAQPQGRDGTHQSWPTAADFRLDRQWSARHAYNFICGTDEWRQPYPILVDGEELLLGRALAYLPEQQLGQAMIRQGAEVAIQFTPGVLRALLW